MIFTGLYMYYVKRVKLADVKQFDWLVSKAKRFHTQKLPIKGDGPSSPLTHNRLPSERSPLVSAALSSSK